MSIDRQSVAWTKIHGRVYDIQSFLKIHPGGSILELAIGRDATDLYQAYHPSESMLTIRRILAKLPVIEIDDGTLKTNRASSAFYYTVRRRVDEFLRSEQLDRHSYQLISLIEIYFTFLLYLIVSIQTCFLHSWTWSISAVIGLLIGRLGFIMHSGNHCAISDFAILNRIAGKIMNVIGGNELIWKYEHQIAHHLSPNDLGHDNDCEIGYPWIRLHPKLKWNPIHRYQPLTVFLGMTIGLVKWAVSDLHNFQQRKVGNVKIHVSSLYQTVELVLGKLFWVGLHLVSPCYFLGIPRGLGSFFVRTAVASLYLETIFIVNHIQEETTQNESSTSEHWAIKQVKTTANWSSGSTFANWISGGLNHQIEHHLFPSMNPYLYPKISGIVKQTCQEFQLPYIEFHSFGSAWTSMTRFIFRLGRKSYKD